jgi:hypothetical protein
MTDRLDYSEYRDSQRIAQLDYGFYALLAAAMRKADTSNLSLLQRAFPGVWRDLQARYNAPGGLIGNERLEAPRRVG